MLLRDFETGDFFKTEPLWTKDQDEATDFEASAVDRELGLRNMEVAQGEGDTLASQRW